ncbi:hypothetical protein [Devosia sp. 1566]|uniref:hypothetical protein n=1 Tax=Devosia sp. 1566 TaxID=2499144 RepID=UPI000FDBA876|nr:hypothetical protein [Devosia sp. 1566]
MNMLQDFGSNPSSKRVRGPEFDRILQLEEEYPRARERLPRLCSLAVDGLRHMALPNMRFPHTMRSTDARKAAAPRPEGDNLRYTINVAQGLAWMPETVQRGVLHGHSARELAQSCIDRAAQSREPGAVALAAWAAAETAGIFARNLYDILVEILAESESVELVPCAWALTAAIAGQHLGDTRRVKDLAWIMLRDAQSPSGVFPHVTPVSAGGWVRGHVGSFADQVYPIQAMARLGYADDNIAALRAADACAARIVELQGSAGQWWWHYDTRDGSVVEGYPVYSVHQHAMAPMALLDLLDAGGQDHRAAIVKGLGWLDDHPETDQPMISEQHSVIWRKVARTEPPKLARRIAAGTTALKKGWHLPGLDAVLRPGKIDYECRPYEFGWLLYAWRSRAVVQDLHP